MAKIWRVGWRVTVAALLLLYIFHNIFLNEAAQVARLKNLAWDSLTRGEQWRFAWQAGPPSLWGTLTSVERPHLILSFVLMGITILLGVIRWRMVLRAQGLNLSLGRATEISFVAHFFNSFLLGSTGGDLMKAYYAARETHHRKPEAVATVFADRLIGLWAMLLFGVLMMLPNVDLLFRHERLRTLSGFVVAMMVACSVLGLMAFRGGVSKTVRGARDWLRRLPKGEYVERSLQSCRELARAPWFLTRTICISMLLNAVCVLQLLVLSWGLHLNIPPMALFVIVPMIICISALPITPSGLGVRENLFVFMLADPVINVEATSALSLSLLAYAGSLFWSIVGGVVYVSLRQRHHLAEMAHEPTTSSRP